MLIMPTPAAMSVPWSLMVWGSTGFLEAVKGTPFHATIGYDMNESYIYNGTKRKPKLTLKGGSAGAFLCMEDLPMIEGDKYYYFYEDGEIFLGEPLLKGKVSDFFQFLHRQVGGDCYIAKRRARNVLQRSSADGAGELRCDPGRI